MTTFLTGAKSQPKTIAGTLRSSFEDEPTRARIPTPDPLVLILCCRGATTKATSKMDTLLCSQPLDNPRQGVLNVRMAHP